MAYRFLIGKRMKQGSVNILKKKTLELKKKVFYKLEEFDFFIMPTVALEPPSLSTLKNKKNYHYYNNLVLDNTRAANIFDLCAISIPLFFQKRKWLSISIISKKNNEEKLLDVAEKIESILR